MTPTPLPVEWAVTSRPTLPPDSVRGRIYGYLCRQRDLGRITAPVLELGSRFPDPSAWWADIRHLAAGEWVGVDCAPGHNVDVVADAESLFSPKLANGRGALGDMFCYQFPEHFATVICSEMLEHVTDPQEVIRQAYRGLVPGGRLIVTTLFAFPVHNHPADYWRFSEAGLRYLLEHAGFRSVETESAGEIRVTLDDHGGPLVEKVIPMHTFAAGVRP